MPKAPTDPLTNKDKISANQLLAICRDGELFYIHAADSVESYSIKRALQQMAIARREMLQQVSAHLELHGYDGALTTSSSDDTPLWYQAAIDQAWDFSDRVVLKKLRTLESNNLQLLIKQTKTASDRDARELMSNVAARFQLCLDLLDAIIAKQDRK